MKPRPKPERCRYGDCQSAAIIRKPDPARFHAAVGDDGPGEPRPTTYSWWCDACRRRQGSASAPEGD